MSEVVVPIDLTEEEKEILAIFSKRQFMIVFPTIFVALSFLIFGNLPFVHGFTDIIIRFIFSLGFFILAICLAFIKLDKYEQYLSEFVLTRIKFKRSQKVYF
ncbi:PrgI family mobile element protein [Bacillus sp. FJAT-29937]|uniref:PrgI family mobile element protein n=1 Tax=Bacillus sp. FJAT-29937 TaxID=1720553 RepID=UPI0008323980|nr:PrgI family protein [Bacillus sp. FJAT-29937]